MIQHELIKNSNWKFNEFSRNGDTSSFKNIAEWNPYAKYELFEIG